MASGKNGQRFYRLAESIESIIFDGGWAARLAYRIGLQGAVETRWHEFGVSGLSLPRAPLRIGFASDFHAGPVTHPKVLSSAFDALVAASPDAILLGGDFVSMCAAQIDSFCDHLQGLRPPQGVYAVLGNHDLSTDPELITKKLQAAGVRVLTNENLPLGPPYEGVYICGIDDPTAGSPDPVRTFAGAEGVRILLMHSPARLELLSPHRVELALAGHTHGGQIALPGGIPILMPSGHVERRYAHGRLPLPNGYGELLVSKGVGFTGLPIRLYAKSEVHICTVNWRTEAPESPSRQEEG
jgi:uncharacterized protein